MCSAYTQSTSAELQPRPPRRIYCIDPSHLRLHGNGPQPGQLVRRNFPLVIFLQVELLEDFVVVQLDADVQQHISERDQPWAAIAIFARKRNTDRRLHD